MSDDLSEQLMDVNDDTEKQNKKIKKKNKQNQAIFIGDEEGEYLINRRANNRANNRQNRNNINNSDKIEINPEYKKQYASIYLLYALQLSIYILLLVFSFDKFAFIKAHSNILFVISEITITIITYIHIREFDNIFKITFKISILLTLISLICCYFFLYKLCIIFTFKISIGILITIVLMYSVVSFGFFFNLIKNIKMVHSYAFFSIFLGLFLMAGFRYIRYVRIIRLGVILFILNYISLIHVMILIEEKIFTNIYKYPIILICLFMDMNIIILFFICIIICKIILRIICPCNKTRKYYNRKGFNKNLNSSLEVNQAAKKN